MEIKSFQLPSSSDDLLLSVSELGVDTPRAIIQLVHGMCEHKERYYDLMKYLAKQGFATIIHDHRGHGASVKSSDDLGYFYEGGFSAAVEDVHIVTQWVKRKYPSIPLILFGHSMGSMIVRSYTKRYDGELSGLIVCGSPSRNPAAGVGNAVARIYEFLCGGHCRPAMIQKLAFGSFNHRFRDAASPNSWICSDPEIVKAYDADSLCNYSFTANGFRNLFALMQDAYSKNGWKLANRSLPIHFIAGSEDPCIGNEKHFVEAVNFMRERGYENVTFHLYPGYRHEIHNEKGKDLVWNDIADTVDLWVNG